MKIYIFIVMVLSSSAYADMTECLRKTDKNEKNYCMAIYSGSGTYCDKITGYETRMDCMRKVIAKQRSGR